MPDYELERVDLILKLLEQTTTLSVVSEFLKGKQLAHSAGSWKALRDDRILPALESSTLGESDLVDLLRGAEEHGRQHVFLYRCAMRDSIALLDYDRILVSAKRMGLARLLGTPDVLDEPASPTVVDLHVRRSSNNSVLALIVKEVDRRTKWKMTSETEEGKIVTRVFERMSRRAVNLVKLHRSGLLEMRIGSHDTESRTHYQNDVARLWRVVQPLIPRETFIEISLDKAKRKIYEEEETLSDKIRLADVTLHGDDDTKLHGIASRNGSVYQAEGLASGLKEYTRHPGRCDGSNVFFLKRESGPARDIHILLSGASNEFAITANCSERDYEYVLREIRVLNR